MNSISSLAPLSVDLDFPVELVEVLQVLFRLLRCVRVLADVHEELLRLDVRVEVARLVQDYVAVHNVFIVVITRERVERLHS